MYVGTFLDIVTEPQKLELRSSFFFVFEDKISLILASWPMRIENKSPQWPMPYIWQ